MESQTSKIRAIDLVVHCLPPTEDAIGEYTACLAAELSLSVTTRVLTSFGEHSAITGVECVGCFSRDGSRRFRPLVEELLITPADSVVVQYNPFAWGRRGWAPDFVETLEVVRRERPDLILACMFHETYMQNRGLKAWLMRQYQRRQFKSLLAASDIAFFSVEAWRRAHGSATCGPKSVHLPVGSNIPESALDLQQARDSMAIPADHFVCGVFGGDHPTRLFPWIEKAVEEIAKQLGPSTKVTLLHVGTTSYPWPDHIANVIRTGWVDATRAADALRSMDILLNPFSDGISTRRGSAIAALRNAVPVLSTDGENTDQVFRQWSGRGVFLAPQMELELWLTHVRECIAQLRLDSLGAKRDAQSLYDAVFRWDRISDAMLGGLAIVDKKHVASR